MNYLKIAARLIVSIAFTVSAWLKLDTIDSFEIYVYSFEFLSLNTAFLLARLLIGLEFLLGLLLLLGVFSRQVVLSSVVLLAGFVFFLAYLMLAGSTEHCHCFGDALEMSHPVSIAKNLVLIALLWLAFIQKVKNRRYERLIFSASVLVSLSLPFIISPPDSFMIEAYVEKTSYNEDLLKEYVQDNDLTEGRKVLCFFGVKCRFCRLSAKKIAVVSQKAENKEMIEYVFWGNDEQIEYFFQETNTPKFSFSSLSPNRFIRITDGKMPLILLLEDGEVQGKYNYRAFDETAIIDFLTFGE